MINEGTLVSVISGEKDNATLGSKKKAKALMVELRAEDDITHQSHRLLCFCVRAKASCGTGLGDLASG